MPKLIDCIEAVAFDLDGTLIDTAPDLGAAANMMLVILGGRPLAEQLLSRADRRPASMQLREAKCSTQSRERRAGSCAA